MSSPGAQKKSEHVLYVKCTDVQFATVKREADKRGLTVSAFVRSVLLEECDFSTTRADARAKPL